MGQVPPEVRTAGFVKCCQDESGFLLFCLVGESTWNVPKLFNHKALIQLQARTKGCTVSLLHPSLPSYPSQQGCLLHCWTGTAQGGINLAWLRSPDWGQESHQYFPVLCQQWKSSNKTSKPLPNNPWAKPSYLFFLRWHNKLGSTVCLLLLLFFLKFQIKWHFHNEFSSSELKAY